MRAFSTPRTILEKLSRRRADRLTLLVGVDGCGGSGKSALAAWIARSVEDPAIVHVDDFHVPAGGEAVGGHFDWRRLVQQVLEPLAEGRAARYQVHDWAKGEPGEWKDVPPGGCVVVEGVTAIRREIAGYYDLTVWVECPRDVRLERGLARDGEAARGQWEREWMPAEDRYVAAHRPDERAHLVLDGVRFLSTL